MEKLKQKSVEQNKTVK